MGCARIRQLFQLLPNRVWRAYRAQDPRRHQGSTPGQDGSEVEIAALFAADPEAVLGRAHVAAYGAQPQLLVKILDAALRPHLQGHPAVA